MDSFTAAASSSSSAVRPCMYVCGDVKKNEAAFSLISCGPNATPLLLLLLKLLKLLLLGWGSRRIIEN